MATSDEFELRSPAGPPFAGKLVRGGDGLIIMYREVWLVVYLELRGEKQGQRENPGWAWELNGDGLPLDHLLN